MAIDIASHFKYIPVETLADILADILLDDQENDFVLHPNGVGNISVYRENSSGEYEFVGYIDFAEEYYEKFEED